MSVTTQPRARLKHMVTFSHLSLTSRELSVKNQWQGLWCIRIRTVCMCVRGNKMGLVLQVIRFLGKYILKRMKTNVFSTWKRKQWHFKCKYIQPPPCPPCFYVEKHRDWSIEVTSYNWFSPLLLLPCANFVAFLYSCLPQKFVQPPLLSRPVPSRETCQKRHSAALTNNCQDSDVTEWNNLQF